MEGERLGAYQIERELGSGGMGKVYAARVVDRARGLTIGDRVALKVVHPHLLETQGFFMRFLQEAQIGASIRHENVVRTHMADALLPHHFLVMEYVEGQDLRALLQELDKVPEELCRHVGREIAKGLGAIHAEGVVHRDLKPENVLITEEHVVKVMDLGVARLADEQMRLSQSGAFVGSAEYAAPEQFGGDVDHRCDLHALGLLLYELSAGQHPYRADDFRSVMKQVCETEPRRLGDINPQLSAFFEEVVHTLLAKSRDDRFADAATVLGVLEEGEDSEWWHERARQLQATTKRPIRRIRIPRETAVYGREKEIAKLRGLFERAKAGDGQVVLLEGEAGIGKSRLVDELISRLQADGEDVNFLFGSYPPGGAATASGAFSAAYREHFGAGGCAEYLLQTPILVPAFDALLKGESAPTGAELLTKDSLQTCFVNATRSLAAERMTVALIDDLHFAPDEGRALFTSLAMAAPGARVLLVGTTRPGVSDEWLAGLTRLDQTSQIPLHRLGAKDLIELLKDCLKSEELAMGLCVARGGAGPGEGRWHGGRGDDRALRIGASPRRGPPGRASGACRARREPGSRGVPGSAPPALARDGRSHPSRRGQVSARRVARERPRGRPRADVQERPDQSRDHGGVARGVRRPAYDRVGDASRIGGRLPLRVHAGDSWVPVRHSSRLAPPERTTVTGGGGELAFARPAARDRGRQGRRAGLHEDRLIASSMGRVMVREYGPGCVGDLSHRRHRARE